MPVLAEGLLDKDCSSVYSFLLLIGFEHFLSCREVIEFMSRIANEPHIKGTTDNRSIKMNTET